MVRRTGHISLEIGVQGMPVLEREQLINLQLYCISDVSNQFDGCLNIW